MMKAAIFDMDGTILDSMPFWRGFLERFLDSKNIAHGEIDDNQYAHIPLKKVMEMVKEEYNINQDSELLIKEAVDLLADAYRNKFMLKNGAENLINFLFENNIPFCIATATGKELSVLALDRLGISERSKCLITCDELGTTKREPLVYLEACKALNTVPSETVVFEDALYAAKTAKQAGFCVVGVYEAACEFEYEGLCRECDVTVKELDNERVISLFK